MAAQDRAVEIHLQLLNSGSPFLRQRVEASLPNSLIALAEPAREEKH